MANQYVQEPVHDRLFSRLIITPAPAGILADGPCLLWDGARHGRGYGRAEINGKTRLVHRLMWEMFEGPIPPRMTLDHLCRITHCASLAHLEVVTQKVNILRGTGPAAANARKMRCIRDHEFDTVRPDGARECSTCKRARNKAWEAQRPPRKNRRRS